MEQSPEPICKLVLKPNSPSSPIYFTELTDSWWTNLVSITFYIVILTSGFPCVDVKVTLKDGAYHPVDSSAIAFEIAAKAAYRQSFPKASPQLLEPIMKVDVFTPDAHVGDVIGDLNRRRGMIKSQDAALTGVRIKADVPLSEMFGYIGDLRTMTSGRGQFSMEFSHYAPCPANVAEEVIKETKEREAAAAK